jgi:hypothetical protein
MGLPYMMMTPYYSKPKARPINRGAESSSQLAPAYLLGLQTFHGRDKTPMNLVSDKLAEASSIDLERVRKYCDCTRVDMGQIEYDVTIPGELDRVRKMQLKERFAICETSSIDMAKQTVADLLTSSSVPISEVTHLSHTPALLW